MLVTARLDFGAGPASACHLASRDACGGWATMAGWPGVRGAALWARVVSLNLGGGDFGRLMT